MADHGGGRPAVSVFSLPAELAGADLLHARDAAGMPVALPEGLQPKPTKRADTAWRAPHLAEVHPADRPAIARAWASARRSPGTVVSTTARTLIRDRWTPTRYLYLDLLHDPRVGAVLMGLRFPAGSETEPAVDPTPSAEPAQETAWGLLEIGAVGEILSVQGMAEAIYGRRAEDLIGTNALDLLHPDDHERLLASWVVVVEQHGTGRALRQRVLHPDGSVLWVMSTIGRLDPTGPVVVHDVEISRQIEAEAALRASEQRFRHLADAVPAAVFVCDRDGELLYRNEQVVELAGSASLRNVGELLTVEDRGHLLELVRTAHGTGFELESVTLAGTVLRVRCAPPQDDGSVVGVIEDVTATSHWRDEARRDSLTGLLSRSAMIAEIRHEIARGEPDTLVAFVDLDDFKAVNDRFGHEEGDRALAAAAQALAAALRPDDRVGRWGGDEFVLLARHVPPDTEAELLDRVNAALSADRHPTGWGRGASVGVSRLRPGDDVHDVMGRADRAMYDVKRARARSDP